MEARGKVSIWSTGLAIFAMFFGAGNVVFPLALGQFTLDKNLWGILGMVVTAVFVPLMGLFAMLLFDGNYNHFFRRVGKVPGFLIVTLILALIGPFAGIPRCITISYATLSAFKIGSIPFMNLVTFSLLNVFLIFFFTIRPNKVLNLIGKVLTPILLISLGAIVIRGIFGIPHADHSLLTRWETFSKGFFEGYNTMDLLATFFFSSVVLLCLRNSKEKETPEQKRRLIKAVGIGSLIAAFLLMMIYVSFSYLAASYSDKLGGTQGHELLGALAHQLLGPYAGLFVGVAVFFACLTTEIALAVVVSRFLSETIFKGKLPYPAALGSMLFISFLISTLNFTGIASFITPILQICYPALIVLAIVNILHKMFAFRPVKLFFYGTLLATLMLKLF